MALCPERNRFHRSCSMRRTGLYAPRTAPSRLAWDAVSERQAQKNLQMDDAVHSAACPLDRLLEGIHGAGDVLFEGVRDEDVVLLGVAVIGTGSRKVVDPVVDVVGSGPMRWYPHQVRLRVRRRQEPAATENFQCTSYKSCHRCGLAKEAASSVDFHEISPSNLQPVNIGREPIIAQARATHGGFTPLETVGHRHPDFLLPLTNKPALLLLAVLERASHFPIDALSRIIAVCSSTNTCPLQHHRTWLSTATPWSPLSSACSCARPTPPDGTSHTALRAGRNLAFAHAPDFAKAQEQHQALCAELKAMVPRNSPASPFG